jgi:hypothetical protein
VYFILLCLVTLVGVNIAQTNIKGFDSILISRTRSYGIVQILGVMHVVKFPLVSNANNREVSNPFTELRKIYNDSLLGSIGRKCNDSSSTGGARFLLRRLAGRRVSPYCQLILSRKSNGFDSDFSCRCGAVVFHVDGKPYDEFSWLKFFLLSQLDICNSKPWAHLNLQRLFGLLIGDGGGYGEPMGFVRASTQFSHLLTQPFDLTPSLYQLASIQVYKSLGLLPSSLHFFELALHNIGLSKKNISSETADEQDSKSKKNHSPSFEGKLRPLLRSVLYVGLLTGLYFLGVKGIALLCTRNDKLGIYYGIMCTTLALAGAIRVFMCIAPLILHFGRKLFVFDVWRGD